MKDTSLDSAIRRSLQILQERRGSSCPDENLMAAYIDGDLTAEEAGRLESHAADCGCCRKVIAILMAEEEVAIPAPAISQAEYSGLGFSWPRVAALAAAFSIVIAGAVLYRLSRQSSLESAVVQVAEVRRDTQLDERPSDVIAAEQRTTAPQALPLRAQEDRPAAKIERPAEEKEKVATVEGTQTAENKELRVMAADKALPVGVETEVGEKPVATPGAVAGQPGITAMGGVGDTRSEKTEPVERKPATPAFGGRGALPARAVTAQAPADVLMEFRSQQEESPRDAIRMMLDTLRGKAGPDLEKILGERRFYRTAAHWVDDRCERAAGIVEIPMGSPDGEEIVRAISGIADLRSTGTPVLIFWKDKNVLLR